MKKFFLIALIAVGGASINGINADALTDANNSKVHVKSSQEDRKSMPARMYIDTPINGVSINNNSVKITGWALNDSGIKEIQVYVDGKRMNNARIGLERADVNVAYPGYNGGKNSGFETEVWLNDIAPGKRKIELKAIGNDGTKQVDSRDINIIKKPTKMFIDTPSNNVDVKNNAIRVVGWALNDSGVKEIQVYVDGKRTNNAQIGLERADVNAAYPGYNGGKNSGFVTEIGLNDTAPGKRKIELKAIGNDGTSHSMATEINIIKKAPKAFIDTPHNNAEVKNNAVRVVGWALNDSGVKEIQVYVDGKRMNNAQIGLERADVNAAYPGYNGGKNSGFVTEIGLNNTAPGKRKIELKIIGNDGTSNSISTEINIIKKPAKMFVDTPFNNVEVKNSAIKVVGWALNDSGVKEIQVYVDGKRMNNAQIGLERADVNAAYPGYNGGKNSGFVTEIGLNDIAPGKRKLELKAIGNDGTSHSMATEINIIKKAPRVCIDTPHNNSEVKDNAIRVVGWALNDSGVKEIQVYVDGKRMNNAQIGLERTDVNAAYPGYNDGKNSGFITEISLNNIAPGKRELKLLVVGNDGTTQTSSINLNLNVAKGKITNYTMNLREQPSLNSKVLTTMAPGSDITVLGRVKGDLTYYHVKYNKDGKSYTGYVSIYLDGSTAVEIYQDNLHNDFLGVLSEKYESNGDPGLISSGVGDYGGKSYGAWQFSSTMGSLDGFVNWLKDKNYSFHKKLVDARKLDNGSNCGPNFDKAWKDIAKNNYNSFYNLQHAYVKEQFYDKLVSRLMKAGDFSSILSSFAGRNVLWSTVVQHGVSGAYNIIAPLKNVKNVDSFISAVYKERGRKNSNGQLVHFISSSQAVQNGVASRFKREEAQALQMYKYEKNK